MHRDAISAPLEGDVHLAENVVARDDEVNRLYFLLVRILRTIIQNPRIGERMSVRSIDCLDYRLCASLVEAIGDSAVEISHKILASEGVKISGGVAQILARFHSVVFNTQEKALKALFGRDVALAEEVRDERVKMENTLHEVESTAQKQSAAVVPIVLTVASLLYRIFGHSVDIADLVMPKES
jgi:phosphate uptake regulator